jgi:pimeloyl-ACP methyl ester carboxylesterase
MASIILIPGAMHGGSTWDRIVPRLERAGYCVLAPDMPGTFLNRDIRIEDATLENWAQFVVGLVLNAEPPVILVGHSRGGLVIGEVAEQVPDRLQGLIYVAALIVPRGKSVRELRGLANDAGNAAPINVLGGATATAMFYNRCTPADAAWAVSHLGPEPARLLSTQATVSPGRWGRVPRAYIECSDDRALSLEFQQSMQKDAPCDPVIRLDSDHSPFLCMPDTLAAAIIRIAEGFSKRV